MIGSALVSLLFWTGCASKAFREPEVSDEHTDKQIARSFSRNFSDVWDAGVATLGEKKYAISVSKRDAGLMVTDWISGKSDRLFSGYGDTRIPYAIRFKLTVKLTLTRGGVRVAIKNEEQYMSDAITAGADFDGSLYQWINTASSGAREASLMTALNEMLGPASSKEKK